MKRSTLEARNRHFVMMLVVAFGLPIFVFVVVLIALLLL